MPKNFPATIEVALPALVSNPANLKHLRTELRAQAQGSAEQLQIAWAQSLVVHAVRAYWRKLAPHLALRQPPSTALNNFPESLQAAATHLGESAALEPVGEAAYHLSLLYAGLLPNEWRSSHGVYYTPPVLANRLLDQADRAGLDWEKAKILDPAAGAGAFLVPAVSRMLSALGNCAPAMAVRNINARLRGYELDSFAAWLSHVFIEAAALPVVIATGRRIGNVVEVRDSLAVELPENGFDLVVGNPPFGRMRLPLEQRIRFARSLYGHANLYGVFIDLAIRLVRPGGLVSFLTPSSFLAGEYFKNLRGLIGREAPPLELDFVTARKGVFEDVLQETVLASYKKGSRRGKVRVNFICPQPPQAIVPEPAGYFTLPCDPGAAWLLARHKDESPLAERLRAMPERLADWGYKISTGPLVWNRFKPQLTETADKRTIPLIWAECVTSDGQFIFRSEKRNHKPYFRVEKDDGWLIVDRPCVLLQRTTAKEQARRLIAAEMPAAFIKERGAVTVENHLNMLIPTTSKPAVPPTLLSAFLNTAAADRAFRCISGSVAVSAYELESLPLPSAADLKKLIGRTASKAALEKACAILYRESAES
jgi:adenine-specific DNA-methyltransferase